MIYSTLGILEMASASQKDGKYTITYDVSDPVDFDEDESSFDGDISFKIDI